MPEADRTMGVGAIAAALWIAACGSTNNAQCGTGTVLENGVCRAATAGASSGGRGGSSTGGSGGSESSTGGRGGLGTGGAGGSSGSGQAGSGGVGPTGTPARTLATKLGVTPDFLVGAIGDAISPAAVGKENIYYFALGRGWSTSTPKAVSDYAAQAAAQGAIPMFSLTELVNPIDFTKSAQMGPYWTEAEALFNAISQLKKPAMVQFEPTFWEDILGFTRPAGTSADAYPAAVSGYARCANLPDTVAGMSKCFLRIRDDLARNTAVGFHVTLWAAPWPVSDWITLLNATGVAQADFITINVRWADAGCLEAHDSECGTPFTGPFYWDETNTTSPNYQEHLIWAKALAAGTGKPLLWWQLPFGVPSDTPGGTPTHYRDNWVHYLFNHVTEFTDAGGIGALFGSGRPGVATLPGTDGGQFVTATTAYLAAPTALP